MRITGLDIKNTPGYIQYADWDKSPFQWHFGRALQKTGIFYRSFNFKVFSRNFFPVTFFHRFYLITTQLKLHDPSRNKIKNDLLSLTKRLTFSKKIVFQNNRFVIRFFFVVFKTKRSFFKTVKTIHPYILQRFFYVTWILLCALTVIPVIGSMSRMVMCRSASGVNPDSRLFFILFFHGPFS